MGTQAATVTRDHKTVPDDASSFEEPSCGERPTPMPNKTTAAPKIWKRSYLTPTNASAEMTMLMGMAACCSSTNVEALGT